LAIAWPTGDSAVITRDERHARHSRAKRRRGLTGRKRPGGDLHVDTPVEAVKDGHEPVHGETAKLGRANARKLTGVDAGDALGLAHRQFAVIEFADDRGGQDRFKLLHIGPGMPQVAEYIAAASDQFQVLVQVSISFSRLIRSRIKSISCFGVLIPLVDFFWSEHAGCHAVRPRETFQTPSALP